MIDPAAPRPKEPAKRPVHHLKKALHHHRAHRHRVTEQAAALIPAIVTPPALPPGGTAP